MDYRNLKISAFLILFSLCLLLIKLFTLSVSLPDDATSLLILKFSPSFGNNYIVTSLEAIDNHIILLSDENGFVGEFLYDFITRYLWWIFFSISALQIIAVIRKKPNG